MQFKDIECLPAVVIENNDPEKQGRIKCIIPGLFENEDDKELYPWIHPMSMNGYQTFSKQTIGSKVLVLQVKSSYNEFYFLPMFDKIAFTSDFLEKYYDNNPEILFFRDNCGNPIRMTYNDSEGFMIQVGDSYINITSDGEIICNAKNANVLIKNGEVYIGSSEDEYETAVKGESLCKILSNLLSAMNNLQTISSSNGMTACLAPGFTQAVKALESYNDIKCNKTKVN